MRTLFIATAITVAIGHATAAQEAIPGFEVVSVKSNRSGSDRQDMRLLPGGRARMINVPLRRIVLTAYGLLPQQLVDAPAWLDADRFDIVAQATENLEASAPGGPPGRAQQMLQRLLAERFKLAAHTEVRDLPIYELVVARADGRLGPRISSSKGDCDARLAAYGRGEAPMPPTSECGGSREPGRLWMRGATMPNFARSILVGWTERIVEDRTGLTGGYDFDLEFTPGSGAAPGTSGASDVVSLFTALEEQLGLKLRATRGRVDVLVIDRVEHPTED